ncbi:serine protease gd-like [Condylostylus longicornis]|uniref:serine protease gd-like n=1 Tax=Condylostylus longicornis TaxID=2530218 RepID=UPI00244DB8CC|nr:serine protease gd-like [Condylostylus longicornis]
MKIINFILIITTIFIDFSKSQPTSKTKYGNIIVKGGRNTINIIYPSDQYIPYNGTVEITKSIEKSLENFFDRLYNTTIKALQANPNGLQSNFDETKFPINSRNSDKDFGRQITEATDKLDLEKYDTDNYDTNKFSNTKPINDNDSKKSTKDVPNQTTEIKQPEKNLKDVTNYDCGIISKPVKSLVGKSIPPGAWPWWAPILKYNSKGLLEYDCGGTLISKYVVLSAASCFPKETLFSINLEIEKYRIGLGLSDRSNFKESNSFIAKITEIIIHQNYDDEAITESYNNNIVMMFLQKWHNFNERIRPTCIWPDNPSQSEIENEEGYVVGFVNNKPNTNFSIFKTNIQSSESCIRSNPNLKSKISDTNFCTKANSETFCFNIYGQGLLIEKNDKLYLRGILVGSIATAYTFCNLNVEAIYTDVSKFYDWITQNIRDYDYEEES